MQLFRSFAIVGGYTILSRVFGFVRDVLMAAVLGAGLVSDAFFVAFRFPNLCRRLFAEGAFSSAFIPIFTSRLEGDGMTAARIFAEQAMSLLILSLLVFTALAEIFTPWLLYILAPGFSQNSDKYDMAVLFSRIMFPYLFCMSLAALLSGVTNAFGRFAAAAAAPILLNTVLIIALSFLYLAGDHETLRSGLVLSYGVMVAGILQLAMLWIACCRTGISLKLIFPVCSPDIMRFLRLAVPSVISGGITQLNLIVGTAIASLQTSAISYLYYAERIYQLPLSVIGIAISVVLLPELTRHLQSGQTDNAHYSQNRSLEFSMLLIFPSAVLCFALAAPIIEVLFHRGAFDDVTVIASSNALMAFSIGLPAFVLIKVLLPGFFAREDMKTPMWCALLNMIVNVIGSVLLYFPFGHVGIAIATSFSGWLNALLLGWLLFRRGHLDLDTKLRFCLPRIFLSTLFMGLIIWPISQRIFPLLQTTGEFISFCLLGGTVIFAFLSFGLIVYLFGGADLRQIGRFLLGRS